MQTRKLNGIILSMRTHGEWDRFITVFSKEMGLVRIIAKGAHRTGSRRSFHLDILNMSSMEIEEYGISNSKKRYLREIFTVSSFNNMKKELGRFASACLIASFLERNLIELSAQKELFSLTETIFKFLNKPEKIKENEIVFTYFLKATRLLGYLPDKLPRTKMRSLLSRTLSDIDPQFILNARRTLGIFSSLAKTRSS